ncbi:MAG: universal stress protein [Candidatus Hydrogenedentes bacterium]|nr:universal stress protein [Candidatus Hydrogenedentota bacterium]
MFKRILVTTDGSDAASIGVNYAVALAAHTGARVVGLHVVDVKLLEGPFLQDVSAALGTAPFVNAQNNISMILEERGQVALQAVQDHCAAQNIECATKQVSGVVHRAIAEEAELADLVVMGRGGEHDAWLEGVIGSTTESVVRRSIRPVLVTGQPEPRFERCVVAYDGSQQAREALHTSVAIALQWKMAINVLTVGEEGVFAKLEEAQAYLSSHGVNAEYAQKNGDPGESIVQYAESTGASLLLMGAFGHSKLREWILGSTTLFALNRAACPVLLTR